MASFALRVPTGRLSAPQTATPCPSRGDLLLHRAGAPLRPHVAVAAGAHAPTLAPFRRPASLRLWMAPPLSIWACAQSGWVPAPMRPSARTPVTAKAYGPMTARAQPLRTFKKKKKRGIKKY